MQQGIDACPAGSAMCFFPGSGAVRTFRSATHSCAGLIKPDRHPRARASSERENAAMPATPRHDCDYLIVGGGIAGASIGHFLAPHGRTVVLERESQPGYHSTGRSAALFMESYGTPQVRALTMASRAFFEQPPEGFTEHPLLGARGAMMVASHGQEAPLHEHWAVLQPISPRGRLLDAAETCALVPVLRREQVIGAVHEPD